MRILDRSFTRDDFKIDFFSGTGAGGQHRNKHQNCVRLKHIDTGNMVVAQDHRSKEMNLRDALYRMADKLKEYYYTVEQKERAPVEEVIRTYNIEDNRVIDHASGDKQGWDKFDIDKAIIARKKGLL